MGRKMDIYTTEARLPLTPLQESIWLKEKLSKGVGIYNSPIVVNIEGQFCEAKLKKSLDALMARHQTLRLRFSEHQGRVYQQCGKDDGACIDKHDLSALRPKQRSLQLIKLIEAIRVAPFDLEQENLLRFALIKMKEQQSVFVIVIHHLISDAWSQEILLSELLEHYYEGHFSRAKPDFDQYAHYVNSMLADNARWNKKLEQLSEYIADSNCASIAHDYRVNREDIGKAGKKQFFTLEGDIKHKLQKAAIAHGGSLFSAMFSIFALTVHRYSGEREFFIPMAIGNRDKGAWSGLIGCLINQAPLKFTLDPMLLFSDFQSQVSRGVSLILNDGVCPFELFKSNEATKLKKPLDINLHFLYQNSTTVVKKVGEELMVSPLRLNTAPTKYDLTASVTEDGDKLSLSFEYCSKSYHTETINTLGKLMCQIAQEVANDMQVALGTLGRVSDTANHFLQGDDVSLPHSSLYAGFQHQCDALPDHLVLVQDETQLSYRQLLGLVNRVYLAIKQEVDCYPGMRIGLFGNRSAGFIASMLAVNRLRASYVPFADSLPDEVITQRLEVAEIDVLLRLTNKAIGFDFGGKIIDFDTINSIPPVPDCVSQTDFSEGEYLAATLDDEIALLFTSGSSGKPKAVRASNRGLLNRVAWQFKHFPLSPSCNVLQKTSVNFVDSLAEIFVPLLSGATSYLFDERMLPDTLALAKAIETNRISHITLVPSLLSALLKAPDCMNRIQCLRFIVCSGEVLDERLVQLIEQQVKTAQVVNIYGSTEVSADVTYCTVSSDPFRHSVIGTPLTHTTVYVLDQQQQPVPKGAVGEICIQGAGVALGYLDDTSPDNQRFLPCPKLTGNAEKLFKSGDLGRINALGQLEYIGRLDNMLKVRGNRFHPNEVENHLQKHPRIREVVCFASSTEMLCVEVAVVPEEPGDIELRNELYAFATKVLPDYMVPNQWHFVSEIPRSSSGKLLRQHVDWTPYLLTSTAREELSPLQAECLALWQDKLGHQEIKLHDNFFAVGGHSLIATELLYSMNRGLATPITLSDFLENPTPYCVCQKIEGCGWRGNNPCNEMYEIAFAPHRQFEEFALLPMQQAYWLGANSLYQTGDVSTSVYFEMDYENLDLALFEAKLNTLIERHPMLRAVVTPEGKQRVLEKVPFYSVERHNLRDCPESLLPQRLMRIRHDQVQQVVELTKWPMFSVAASQLNEKRFKIHFQFQMIMIDLFSSQLLMNELGYLYSHPNEMLADIGITFRDYVVAFQEQQDVGQFDASKVYWQKRINTLPQGPQLPLRANANKRSKSEFVRKPYKLEAEKWQSIKQRLLTLSVSPTSFLLTTFSNVLGYWARGDEFTINLTQFNRMPWHKDISRVVGDFTSSLLHHFRYNKQYTFEQSLLDVHSLMMSDLAHSFYGGVDVMRDIASSKGGRGHLFPIVFTSVLGLPKSSGGKESANRLHGNMSYSVTQSSQVWLDFQVAEDGEDLVINWDVVEAIFPDGLIDLVFDSYCKYINLLSQEPANWNTSTFCWLNDHVANRKDSSTKLSRDLAVFPDGMRLFDSVLKSAEMYPNHTAVVSASRSLDYRTFVEESLCLARQLQELGIGKGNFVALLMNKDWDVPVAMMGVTLAGAAYIPLDPQWPEERLKLIVNSAPTPVIICQAANVALGESLARVVRVGQPNDSPLALEQLAAVTPTDLAYVIYTSGTTGQPKGVMIDHRGAVNTIQSINQLFNVDHNDNSLCVSSLCFDLSVYDIWGLLACGGTVIMPEDKVTTQPWTWSDLLEKYNISIWNTVPALAQLLLDSNAKCEAKSLRLCLLSGDWIPLELPNRFKSRYLNADVVSLGGATEASIWSIYFPVDHVREEWVSIPYGKSLPGQQVMVLDESLHVCPTWKTGNIYIAGVGVAQGYLGNQTLTEQQFILSAQTDERLYKTGDLGRFMDDGNIEFLGREDNQVKLNGYRIELGEIEKALGSHPLVKDSIVTLLDNNKLVAHMIVQDSASTLDNIPYSVLGDNVLQNPIERLKFKIQRATAQTGEQQSVSLDLQRVATEQTSDYLRRQSYREFKGRSLRSKQLNAWLGAASKYALQETGKKQHGQAVIDSPVLQRWLSCLVALHIDGFPLHKYRYPSAGHSYAVSALVSVSVIEGSEVEPGYYRLDAKSGQLHRVGLKQPDDQKIGVWLIGEPEKIAPLYGDWSEKFIHQEAGYMAGLLDCQARVLSLSSSIDTRSVPSELLWSETCTPLAWVGLQTDSGSNDWLRSYIVDAMGIAVVLPEHIHDYVDDRHYVFDHQSKVLLDLPESEPVHEFRLFLHQDPDANCTIQTGWLASGVFAQYLMELAEEFSIGMCPIGQNLPHPLSSNWQMLQNFNGGSLSAEQILHYQITQEPNSAAHEFDSEEYAEHLRRLLPDYLVPSYYRSVEQFPKSVNGKIDRDKLNEQLKDKISLIPSARPPVSAVEHMVASLWSQILKIDIDTVGVNFFALGGDSLKATQMVSQLRTELGQDIRLKDLYDHAVLEEFAGMFEGLKGVGHDVPPKFAGQLAEVFEPFPLSEMQRSYLLGVLFQDKGKTVSANSYFEIDYMRIDLGKFENAINALIRRHHMLRSIVVNNTTQRVLRDVPLYKLEGKDIRQHDLSKQQDMLESTRFELSHMVNDPTQWPNVSVRYTRHGEDVVRIHVSFDLIVADTWSANIIVHDLFRLYMDQADQLQELEISFRDFIQFNQQRCNSKEFNRAQTYWLEKIPNMLNAPMLPMAKHISQLSNVRFVRRKAEIDAALWRRLQNRVKKIGMTQNSLLVTVFANTLRKASLNKSFTLNLTEYNRPGVHPQENWLVGNFTSTLLLECEHQPGLTLIDQIGETCSRILEGKDHGLFSGIEVMRELSKHKGGLSSMPIVFTSALGIMEDEHLFDHSKLELSGNTVFAVTQTPQILFDHQLHTRNGALILVWDTMDEVFDDQMLDQMFADYCNQLRQLATQESAWHQQVQQEEEEQASYLVKEDFPLTLASDAFAETNNIVELALSAVWQEVLQRDEIELEDNFFHLGGSSLQALQILSRIHERYNIELDLQAVMLSPRLRGMVELVSANQAWVKQLELIAELVD